MRNLLIISSLTCLSFNSISSEPVCHKCEEIREYNRTHKETDFIYYEDYLKDKEEKAQLKSTKNPPQEEQKVEIF